MDYTRKNKILLAGFILGMLLVFFLLVKPVVHYSKRCSELSRNLQTALQADRNSKELKKRIEELEKITVSSDTLSTVQQQLLGAVSAYCNRHNTILREIPKTVITRERDYVLETYIFTVEGSYPQLLGMIYNLEVEQKIGKVASVNFKTKVDLRTHKKSLFTTVYLQTIKKIV